MRYIKKLIPQPIKNIYHLKLAILANIVYGFPTCSATRSIAGRSASKIKVIGVTGTNGKTTTVQMIAKILESSGKRIAVASTINFKIGDKQWVNKSKFTTLSSFKVQKFIKQAVNAGCEYLVLEVSSHSLDQNRVWGVPFDVAVITNVTREHLDYHKTMEKYRKAKAKLFKKAKTAVVNLDMDNPVEFLAINKGDKYVYSAEIRNSKSEMLNKLQITNYKLQKIFAENLKLDINYSKFSIPASSADKQNYQFRVNLPGVFNIENALAATCVGLNYGISLENIAEALEEIKGVPGRMESVPNDKGLNIIIDYALTPDSLEKLYNLIDTIRTNSLSFAPNSRVLAVFGSCGDRDRGKRPIMGEIVSRHADIAIVTNEDPYTEDPQKIIDEVFEGVKKNMREDKNAFRVLDRREAIAKALQIARPGDTVVITGKGAEETMQIGAKQIPWSDRQIILEELTKLN